MTRTNDADELAEYVNERIQHAIEHHGVNADVSDAAQVGKDDDAYLSARIQFSLDTRAQDVAEVKRTLPMSFDTELRAEGSNLVISVRADL